MFARVTTTQGSPEQFDEAVRYIQEQLIPGVKGSPGLMGGYWLGDRQTGKGITITLWESAEAMQASEEMASQLRTQGVQATGGALQSVDRYEVVGQV